jgi:protein N-terminal methyltransferase
MRGGVFIAVRQQGKTMADITQQIEGALKKQGNPINGKDSEDDSLHYLSITEWKRSIGLLNGEHDTTKTAATAAKSRKKWYNQGLGYWEDAQTCPATVNGMLGGFANISKQDLAGSAQFITYIKSNIRPALKLTSDDNAGVPTCACECGAGIGRVSKGLLLPLGISQCDLVEPSPRLISSAPEYLGVCASKCRFFCTGLQDFEPKTDSYDIIWMQWMIGYLTDDDLVQFLKRCVLALRKGGLVVVKDNTCEKEAFVVDRVDASTTRSLPYIKVIAELAGLRVVHQRYQEGFPEDIFPVPMIAFAPDDNE